MTNGNRWAIDHPELRKTQGTSRHANFAQPTPRKKRKAVQPLPLRAPERAGDVIVIWLPLPPPELQPNRKTSLHHMARARLTKASREAAGFIAGSVRPDKPWTEVRIDATLWTAGKPDRSGCIGWLKSYEDALQDAGIIANDSGVHWGDVVRNTGKASEGRREVELTVTRVN